MQCKNIFKSLVIFILISCVVKEISYVLPRAFNYDSFQVIDELQFKELKPPVITLCIGSGWRNLDISLSNEMFQRNQYSWDEIFHIETMKTLRNETVFKIEKTYTTYFGMCFTIEKLTHESVSDISFQIVVKNSHDYVYYLHEPYEQTHIFMGVLPYEIEMKYIDSNNFNDILGSAIIYKKEKFRKIPGKSECTERSMEDYIGCIESALKNSLKNADVKCKIAAMLYMDQDFSNLEFCNNQNDALETEKLIYEIAQDNHKNEVCDPLCNRTTYENVITFVGRNSLAKEIDVYGEGYYFLWAYYSTLYVNDKIETYVYDFDSALMAIGGSLGLFLGWSINSLVMNSIDLLHERLMRRELSNIEYINVRACS